MVKTKTVDIDATVGQIRQLEQAGCDIVRIAVPDVLAARALASIKNQIHIPLVADIHFDYRLALIAIDMGVDKIRINPGNIGDTDKIKQVLAKAKENNIPIRIGVNSGSLEKDIIRKYGHPCAEALVESAMRHVRISEDFLFDNLIISLKSSDVKMTIDAYRLIATMIDYPLHLGITEAGAERAGIIKSAIGIGTLLQQGIGDTIRVSLTTDPVKEVAAGIDILHALNLRNERVTIISCPTCGRTETNLFKIVSEVENRIARVQMPLKIAIMGCTVNGPGEAREADIGIACGRNKAVLFKQGTVVRTISEPKIIGELLKEISKYSA